MDQHGKGEKGERLLSFPDGVEANTISFVDEKLVFIGQLWEGHGFEDTPEMDRKYGERGNSGVVFDELFIR